MNTAERYILALYAAIVAWWLVRHLIVTLLIRWTDQLFPHSPRFQAAVAPLVTAIIPAKDEAEDLRDCLETVQAQSYPNLEILIVDDRSVDGTSAIARAIAAEDERVRVLTITELPSGWTGKCHAAHRAAAKARGEWLWFLDADTRHAPDSLSIVLEYARSRNAALVSLLPEMRCETFWERVVQPLMGVVLVRSFPIFLVNHDRCPIAFANGQYILVERSAYDLAGGHAAVRDRFVEDIYLAKNVKSLGLPIRAVGGIQLGSTRMYASLPQLIRGWSRILYDANGRRSWPLIGKILEPLIYTQTGFVALIAALGMFALGHATGFAWSLLALAVAHFAMQFSLMFRVYGMQSPGLGKSAIWYPLAGFVADWVLIKSILMCWTGRVRWRGTDYGPTATAAPAQELDEAAVGVSAR